MIPRLNFTPERRRPSRGEGPGSVVLGVLGPGSGPASPFRLGSSRGGGQVGGQEQGEDGRLQAAAGQALRQDRVREAPLAALQHGHRVALAANEVGC